mgnify:CR=1 FL=1
MDNKDYLLNLIDTLEDKNQSQLKKLYQDIIEEMPNAKWSSNNKHQWREWWYYDHIADILKFGKILYDNLNAYRKLPFSFDDVIIVILIHDIEKPYKYAWDKEKHKDLLMLNDHSIRDNILIDLCFKGNKNKNNDKHNDIIVMLFKYFNKLTL